ncbi:probable polyamine oxidase 5 [Prosopis cineraria]|uniref:probable polyamine oxidase 5 n=1 Tax=Prosopis cineraria TaxID=364024 RepID=UPI00240E9FF2|nr:probable polyamine oxidase 5 [Prosopis cineraria]
MVVKKPRIVIIGAGIAGLTAAHKLYTSSGFKDSFELCVVEASTRIGGRICTSEFCGDRIELGATWIHGIGNSPIHKIAKDTHSLDSDQPWECMDGGSPDTFTIAEGGFKLSPAIVDPIAKLFKTLMDQAQGKTNNALMLTEHDSERRELYLSLGSFLRNGLEAYWDMDESTEELKGYGKWSRKLLQEAIFKMYENTQRTYTSANDLMNLDYSAESEYTMFPGEEITIAKGYIKVVESLASVLPPGIVQLGRKVTKIEWKPQGFMEKSQRPVKIHFYDGSAISAEHVIITVSLGVLKAAIREDSGMFYPPLPLFKAEAISRLGFGVVNKLFLQQESKIAHYNNKNDCFPSLQMVFHPHDSELRNKKIPWWMRRTASVSPIYSNSNVLQAWFAGDEALALESLKDEEIKTGVSATISSLVWDWKLCNNGTNADSEEKSHGSEARFSKILKSKWGSDPLFLGSYSYVPVGSSGEDLDTMAEPLPKRESHSKSNFQCSSSSSKSSSSSSPPLQILFAGEATHRTHYSTTHGAYFSGLREANRLLQHYHCVGIFNDQ